jgi:hypothetical protein
LELSTKFGFRRPKKLIVTHDKFYSDRESLSLGEKIVKKINEQEDKELRKTYKSIRDFHFPHLQNII